jgi:hypothetical protein
VAGIPSFCCNLKSLRPLNTIATQPHPSYLTESRLLRSRFYSGCRIHILVLSSIKEDSPGLHISAVQPVLLRQLPTQAAGSSPHEESQKRARCNTSAFEEGVSFLVLDDSEYAGPPCTLLVLHRCDLRSLASSTLCCTSVQRSCTIN